MALWLLRLVCTAEAATGLDRRAHPPTFIDLPLGSEITGAGIVISRICGIALIALSAACWPGGASRGLQGMAVFSTLAAAYMAVVGLAGGQSGMTWWPAFAAHAVLGTLPIRALFMK